MRTLLLLSALALASCSVTEPRTVAISVEIDPAQVTPTDSVAVTLLVINRSSRTMVGRAPGDYGPCLHPFRVFSGDTEVAVPVFFCATVGFPPIQIFPGDTATVTDYWKPGDSRLNGQPLPPGSYRLVGTYEADNQSFSSPTVFVTLLP